MHASRKVEEAPQIVEDLDLCVAVARYLGLMREAGTMIFDGAGPPDKSGFDDVGDLEIIFAGLGADADAAIEDKIAASTAPKRLTIVSSDRRLRKAARTRKCTSLKSEVFWADVQKQLSRKRPAPEPPAKRNGLSDGETDQWLDVFGL